MQPLKVEMSPQPEDGQADMAVGISLQQDEGQADMASTAGNLGASIEMAIQIAAVVCSAPPVRIAVFCTGEDHGNVVFHEVPADVVGLIVGRQPLVAQLPRAWSFLHVLSM